LLRGARTRPGLILQAILDAPSEESYGLEIIRASGVGVGTAYAILRRLEGDAVLDGRWEVIEPQDHGRPPRRYYRLSDEGRRVAIRETAALRDALRLLAPCWSTN
jgi:PadR family transcriptional regulator, regulatory protein PadR